VFDGGFMNRKFVGFIGLTIISWILSFALSQFSQLVVLGQQVSSQKAFPAILSGSALPTTALSCLEPRGKNYEVAATVVEGQSTFYYLHIWLYGIGNDFESWYSLIRIDSAGQCQSLIHSQSGLKSLSNFMSTATARQMELKRYEKEISHAGGKQAFQQRLNDKLSPPKDHRTAYTGVKTYLSEEEVWALHQLGVNFPKTYQVLHKGETIKE
jgi:hypothetical protein